MRSSKVSGMVLACLVFAAAAGAWSQVDAQASLPPPINFQGRALSTTEIEWTWISPVMVYPYLVEGFVIYDADSNRLVGSVIGAGASIFVERGLSENTQYRRYGIATYRDITVPASLSWYSGPSNMGAKYTFVAGHGLTATALSPTSVSVKVELPSNSTQGQTSCEIMRNGVVIKPYSPVYTFEDTGLQPGTEYVYTAHLRNGDSTNEVSANPYPVLVTTPAEAVAMTIIDGDPLYLPQGDIGGDEMKPGNSVLVQCSWTGTGDPERRKITVRIVPSYLIGQCTNSGERNLADFAIEALNNPDWEVGAADELGGNLEYDGLQSLIATTREAVACGVKMPLYITSYDWGGNVLISAQAEGCQHHEVAEPFDDDKDRLPDEFEKKSFYYTAKREPQPFDPKSLKSPGLQAASDDLDDSDLDNRATPVHATPGDGLTAFEEYRAIHRSYEGGGGVFRTMDLKNDGPGGGCGGTHVKDIFVFDEKDRRGNPFFVSENPFLDDFRLIWHLIAKDAMSDDGDKAGFIDKAGDRSQRAIRIRHGNLAKVRERTPLGSAQDLRIRSGLAIIIDDAVVSRHAERSGIPLRVLMNWVVAHEIAHKLSLEHSFRELTRSPVRANVKPRTNKPVSPTFGVYWDLPGNQSVRFWTPVYVRNAWAAELEYVEGLMPNPTTPDANVPEITSEQGLNGRGSVAPENVTLPIHGVQHRIGVYTILLNGSISEAAPPIVLIRAHLQNLLDPILDPADRLQEEKDPLNTDQEKIPNVKS